MADGPRLPSREDDADVARRVDRLTGALRASGFKLTHQRLEVVNEAASAKDHPDAETVFTRVRTRVPTISLDTVYRTLGTLADLGMLDRVSGLSGAVRYDANDATHHHFVCTRCGLIRDVEGSMPDLSELENLASVLGSVSRVEVRLRGECRQCAEKEGSR